MVIDELSSQWKMVWPLIQLCVCLFYPYICMCLCYSIEVLSTIILFITNLHQLHDAFLGLLKDSVSTSFSACFKILYFLGEIVYRLIFLISVVQKALLGVCLPSHSPLTFWMSSSVCVKYYSNKDIYDTTLFFPYCTQTGLSDHIPHMCSKSINK